MCKEGCKVRIRKEQCNEKIEKMYIQQLHIHMLRRCYIIQDHACNNKGEQ